MASGVRVVGGSSPGADEADRTGSGAGAPTAEAAPRIEERAESRPDERAEMARHDVRGRRSSGQDGTGRRRRAGVAVLAVLAVLGLAGTVGFGVAWKGLQAKQAGEAQARAAARSFLVDLTNFNAKTVDADFSAVSSMATGPFAAQAQKFFNSAIRQELQKALASSRGQVRALYVQSYGGGNAAVYAVVDQLYVNDKLTSPQTDVLRIVVDLSQVSGRWKVADVTVLQGPSLGTPSGSSSTGPSGSGG